MISIHTAQDPHSTCRSLRPSDIWPFQTLVIHPVKSMYEPENGEIFVVDKIIKKFRNLRDKKSGVKRWRKIQEINDQIPPEVASCVS